MVEKGYIVMSGWLLGLRSISNVFLNLSALDLKYRLYTMSFLRISIHCDTLKTNYPSFIALFSSCCESKRYEKFARHGGDTVLLTIVLYINPRAPEAEAEAEAAHSAFEMTCRSGRATQWDTASKKNQTKPNQTKKKYE